MARYEHLPIWRDATRLLLVLEQSVKQFPRYHKVTMGSELRNQAMTVCRLVIRANNARQERSRSIGRLVLAVADLKVLIQLAKELKACAADCAA
ncbi:MAG: four helix bundle protein [Methylococcales bacterium]